MSEIARIPAAGLALATALALGGCASTLSGVGGAENYACKAPVGAQCTSISGVYANAAHSLSEIPQPPQKPSVPIVMSRYSDLNPPAPVLAGNQALTHPGSASQSGKTHPAALPFGAASTSTATITANTATVTAAAPTLRTNPRVLRLWIAPWEDNDGDLHDASFVHVVVDTGHWLIDRVRPAARSRLDVATPPTPSAVPTSDANLPGPRGASPQSLGSAPESSSAER